MPPRQPTGASDRRPRLLRARRLALPAPVVVRDPRLHLFVVEAVQPAVVLAEELALHLSCQRREPVALDQILGHLEVEERVEHGLGVNQHRPGRPQDPVLPGRGEQRAEDLREAPRRREHEADRPLEVDVHVGVAGQQPGRFVDERKARMQDLEVDLREHARDFDVVDAVGVQPRRPDREVLVHGDALSAAVDRFLDHGNPVVRVIEAHGDRLSVDEPRRVDLDPVRTELANRMLDLLERPISLERVDRRMEETRCGARRFSSIPFSRRTSPSTKKSSRGSE